MAPWRARSSPSGDARHGGPTTHPCLKGGPPYAGGQSRERCQGGPDRSVGKSGGRRPGGLGRSVGQPRERWQGGPDRSAGKPSMCRPTAWGTLSRSRGWSIPRGASGDPSWKHLQGNGCVTTGLRSGYRGTGGASGLRSGYRGTGVAPA